MEHVLTTEYLCNVLTTEYLCNCFRIASTGISRAETSGSGLCT